jgi:Fe-S oxidoreductase
MPPRDLPPGVTSALAGLDLPACATCGACAGDCPITGLEGLALDIREVLRLLATGQLDAVAESRFPWICTGCGRCSVNCPADIDIVSIMDALKARRPRDKVPGTLHKGTIATLETGNCLAIPLDDYLQTLADMGAELAGEECPGFYVPVDKPQADILFFPNSKEIFGDFDDLKWWWKIFYAARESWTVPSQNWEAVDWGLFAGNRAASLEFARRKIEICRKLEAKTMIMPDGGGASYGCRLGLKACAADDPAAGIDCVYLYTYLVNLIQSGRLTLDKSRNAGKTFTWHDSCKHGRELERHFGYGYYDEPRWILSQCVDDLVELEPTRGHNYCCGAGGGNWPLPFEAESAWHGRFKVEQIRNSGADVVVVGCSTCHDQIMKRLPKFYKGECSYQVKFLWEVVAESLVLTPWTEAEIARGQAEAAAQWERYGIEPDSF